MNIVDKEHLYPIHIVIGTTKFTIKIFQEEDKSFYVEVVELPGCFTAGETMDELKKI